MQKFNELNDYNIILASQSPRRKELLASLNINFSIAEIIYTDESYPSTLKTPVDIVCYLAEKKSKSYKLNNQKDIIITADTIVECKNKILGKPTDYKEAFEMLKFLSGKTHQVITGICLNSINKKTVFYSTTKVKFCKLTEDEIDYYINNYKPFDKAGAYGIQEWIGLIAVEKINGSFYNVVGLPVQKLYRELLKFIKQ